MDYRFFLMKLEEIQNQLDKTRDNLYKYFAMSAENRKIVREQFEKIQKCIAEIIRIIGENA